MKGFLIVEPKDSVASKGLEDSEDPGDPDDPDDLDGSDDAFRYRCLMRDCSMDVL